MESNTDRRTEQRLRYHWPVWFAEDFNKILSQGQMVDISSTGAAFTCYSHENCPYPGQNVTTRFSVPFYGPDESFEMASFTRVGTVRRVDDVNEFLRKTAIEFAEPLPFKPGEQTENEVDTEQNLTASTI